MIILYFKYAVTYDKLRKCISTRPPKGEQNHYIKWQDDKKLLQIWAEKKCSKVFGVESLETLEKTTRPTLFYPSFSKL